MKVIIAKNPKDGSVCVLTPSNNNEDDAQLLLLANQVFSLDYQRKIIENSLLFFVDEIFFDALEYETLQINILKAKKIWLDYYRRARNPLLASLDVDFMRAVESNNTELQKQIATKKQTLRDVTKTDLPDTLEGIKSAWPEILGKNPLS